MKTLLTACALVAALQCEAAMAAEPYVAFASGAGVTALDRFDSSTGGRIDGGAYLDDSSGQLPFDHFGGMTFSPDGKLYVAFASGGGLTALDQFDPATGSRIGGGVYLDDSSGDLPLDSLGGMAFSPDGQLYVAFMSAGGLTALDQFDPLTGARVGQGVYLDDSSGALPLSRFVGMAFSPDGKLYVAFGTGAGMTALSQFDPLTGKRIGAGITFDDTSGGLPQSKFGGMAFSPEGHLYVAFGTGAGLAALDQFDLLTGARIGDGVYLDNSSGSLPLGQFGAIAFAPSIVGGGAVPEPSAWVMMILGMGASGAVLRRRKARSRDVFYAAYIPVR